MRTSSNIGLISALTIILLSALAISPAAADVASKRHGKPQGAATGSATGSVGAQDARRTRSDARADDRGLPEAVTQAQELESILGREIRTSVEEDVGRIIDLLADRDGHVQAAVVELGGFLGIGTRKIAVEWSALRFETKGKQSIVILDMSRDQLRLAPEYKPSEPAIVRKAVR